MDPRSPGFRGPFQGRIFLVAVDAHSKWPEVVEMPSNTASHTVMVLRRIFAAYGLPEQLVSDNGPQFVAEDLVTFCQVNGIKHIRVSPYHPSSNGLAVRFLQTFEVAMRKSVKDGLSLAQQLSSFLQAYRATPQATTSVPPAVLFRGRNLHTHLDLLRPDVGITVAQYQSRQKEQHDCHSRPRSFQVGQEVLVRAYQGSSRWVPATVVQELGPVSVTVRTSTNQLWKRHFDQIPPRLTALSPVEGGEEEDLDACHDLASP